MLSIVDEIPQRFGPWATKRLSFKDSPDEFFFVRHRDPIEAIRGLWGDPAFAEHLVYKPVKMFRNSDRGKKDRIYNEMWTGALWNGIQVDFKLGDYDTLTNLISIRNWSLKPLLRQLSSQPIRLSLPNSLEGSLLILFT